MISRENNTVELLTSVLELAYYQCSVIDGVLEVDGRFKVLIEPHEGIISMIALFGIRGGASELDLLRTVDLINGDYRIPKVYIQWIEAKDHENPMIRARAWMEAAKTDPPTPVSLKIPLALVTEFVLQVGAGISEKSFVEGLRLFTESLSSIEELRAIAK